MSEIDNHIKNTLSEYNAPFDPNDWAAMEKLLDKKKKRRALWFWFFGAALLLGAVGTGTYFSLQQSSVLTSAIAKETPASVSNIEVKENQSSTYNEEIKSKNNSAITTSETTSHSNSLTTALNHTSVNPTQAPNQIYSSHAIHSTKKEKAASTIRNARTLEASIQKRSNKNNTESVLLTEENTTVSESLQPSMAIAAQESIDTLPLFQLSLAEEEAHIALDTAKRKQGQTKKTMLRWYIEANGGVSVPFIKNSSFARIEPDANLLLGLQFKRWRCFAGLGYSNMNVGFDLKKDQLAIQTNDTSTITFISAAQHYLTVPIGIGFSVYRNKQIDVFVAVSMINLIKVSNERKGIYKKIDNILLVPNDNSYAIADIKSIELSKAYQNNAAENIKAINQLLSSTLLSSQKHYLSGKFSVGLSYKITPSLNWNVEGSYTIAPKLSTYYGHKMGFTGNTGFRFYFK